MNAARDIDLRILAARCEAVVAVEAPDEPRAQFVGACAAFQPLPNGFDEVVVLFVVAWAIPL